ncbi:MAG TPA: AAA family ATPase [Vicinamibacterales bacterium]|nr:AAA family ATPase [Vicinamibacterales bacterium]
MYERFFGLNERAFDLTPNPRFLYLTPRHREALSNIRYGVEGRKGVTVLIGEAGTGKTTLLRAALEQQQGRRIQTVTVSNPALTRMEFFEFLAASFELSPNAANSKSRFLFELTRLVRDQHEAGVVTALMIDESQSLSDELLEEIRLLANIETPSEKLLPVVLIGQPELADRLNQPQLRQLKQRVALRCVLTPLDLRETAAYIATRLRIAGGECARVFTRDAVATVFERSGGIPRTISVICDNALLNGFAADQRPVGRDLVLEVCRDFDLRPTARDTTLQTSAPAIIPTSAAERPPAAVAVGETRPANRGLFESFSRRRRFSFF